MAHALETEAGWMEYGRATPPQLLDAAFTSLWANLWRYHPGFDHHDRERFYAAFRRGSTLGMSNSEEKAAKTLKSDLDDWASLNQSVPDFWDEFNTSERIAEWLAVQGYRKTPRRSG